MKLQFFADRGQHGRQVYETVRRMHAKNAVVHEVLKALSDPLLREQIEEDLFAVLPRARFQNHDVVKTAWSLFTQLLTRGSFDVAYLCAATSGIQHELKERLRLSLIQVDHGTRLLIEMQMLLRPGVGGRRPGIQANDSHRRFGPQSHSLGHRSARTARWHPKAGQ